MIEHNLSAYATGPTEPIPRYDQDYREYIEKPYFQTLSRSIEGCISQDTIHWVTLHESDIPEIQFIVSAIASFTANVCPIHAPQTGPFQYMSLYASSLQQLKKTKRDIELECAILSTPYGAKDRSSNSYDEQTGAAHNISHGWHYDFETNYIKDIYYNGKIISRNTLTDKIKKALDDVDLSNEEASTLITNISAYVSFITSPEGQSYFQSIWKRSRIDEERKAPDGYEYRHKLHSRANEIYELFCSAGRITLDILEDYNKTK